jgi:hypothetical protein
VLFPLPAEDVVVNFVIVVVADVVVFVLPGATVLLPCTAGTVAVVLVFPGAVALFPCEAPAAGVVFVCPGADALLPRTLALVGVVVVFPGAVALFPCEAPAAPVAAAARAFAAEARRSALAVFAAKSAAVNAGRRSEPEGW